MANFDFNSLFGEILGSDFGTTPSTYEADLDKYWCKHMENYYTVLNNAKSAGYKVFRNKDGKHKVRRSL